MQPDSAKLRSEGSLGWLLLEFGEERNYAGHDGYDDDPRRSYVYDSFVQNHLQVQSQDLVLLADQDVVHGVARVTRIREAAIRKRRMRCPDCAVTGIYRRKTLRPRFRCKNGHLFAEPRVEFAACTEYRAFYGDTYVALERPIELRDVSVATAKGNQLAIRALDMRKVRNRLFDAMPLDRPLP